MRVFVCMKASAPPSAAADMLFLLLVALGIAVIGVLLYSMFTWWKRRKAGKKPPVWRDAGETAPEKENKEK